MTTSLRLLFILISCQATDGHQVSGWAGAAAEVNGRNCRGGVSVGGGDDGEDGGSGAVLRVIARAHAANDAKKRRRVESPLSTSKQFSDIGIND